ncbi:MULTISPECIES: YafY family protein [unclassified Isoptericola]|uniref:helix-turn-helix transcriptional regulator n=1 Tax=unclassified Isoptericola TaxID=2623355 RepID=UPI002713DDA9|nr:MULTISPECIES: WYL domain-containing protein [unclassified Isoptericola]MDO8149623.1 WYL domain-containing protein [Isoptericola sp. b515]MDO8152557.1 WYL domain-containing protein [Isoptericola sp. b408]
MAERADDRLVRLLGIVAYLDGAGPVDVEELAHRFGVTPARLREDIDALWVSGTPGYMPDDLIDFDAFSLEEGLVSLTQSRGLTRPLRLGTREAVALVAALRAMSTTPAVQADPARAAVVTGALDKLTAATGEAASAVDVRLGGPEDVATLGVLSQALAAGRRVRLRYVDAADVTSERDVDPWRLLTQSGATYLVGWCHRAGGRRTFRVDRVLGAELLDVPVEARGTDADVDVAAQVVADAAGRAREARVRWRSAARWVAEEVPVEEVTDLADGSFEVRLRVTNPAWLRRLLLTHAVDVLAVEPPQVAAEVAAAAREALAAYDEG